MTNKTIIQGLKIRMDNTKEEWAENLLHVLWSYRTIPTTATNETPYSLVYGLVAAISAEIEVPTARISNCDLVGNDEVLRTNLDLLIEWHN